jgi:DNA-binding PadR family transcriptional regulator
MERELLLLGLLRRSDMHGYQLHEFIERNMAACTDLKKSAAYYLLDQMARRGWVRVSEESAEGRRPVRRVYTITEAGEAAYQSLLRANLARAFTATFPGNIGLAYLDDLPLDEVLPLLRQRLAQLQAQAKALESVPSHPGSLQYLIDHQRHHLRSEIVWLERVIADLHERSTKGESQ